MPRPPAPPLQLRSGDRKLLQATIRKSGSTPRQVLRARVMLACASGKPHSQIAEELGTSMDLISRWRKRYLKQGLGGLEERPRSGRPRIHPKKKKKVAKKKKTAKKASKKTSKKKKKSKKAARRRKKR